MPCKMRRNSNDVESSVLDFKEALSCNKIINLSFAYQDSSTGISNQRTSKRQYVICHQNLWLGLKVLCIEQTTHLMRCADFAPKLKLRLKINSCYKTKILLARTNLD